MVGCEVRGLFHAVTTVLQHRDWIQDEDFPSSLGNDRTCWATEVRAASLAPSASAQRLLLNPVRRAA